MLHSDGIIRSVVSVSSASELLDSAGIIRSVVSVFSASGLLYSDGIIRSDYCTDDTIII
jgi:hypothetical protein